MSLRDVLRSGRFAVTAEIGPPRSASADSVRRKAAMLRDHVDAVNLTDNQTAVVRLSSLASSLACLQEGAEPVMQMTCRDRNRIALQSDALGAASLGIRNILCLSGDHQTFGDQKGSKNVYDLDSIQLLMALDGLRKGSVLGGDKLDSAPDLFLGAAANPFAGPKDYRAIRLAKKVAAGADFVQTQAVFDVDRFEEFMAQARDLGIHEKAGILAGVLPVKSAKAARFMQAKVAGMSVPDEVVERMSSAQDAKREGVAICVETIERLRRIDGVRGVHIMAVAWEDVVPSVVEMAGIKPVRP